MTHKYYPPVYDDDMPGENPPPEIFEDLILSPAEAARVRIDADQARAIERVTQIFHPRDCPPKPFDWAHHRELEKNDLESNF
jgi:hypothetical protein